MLRDDNFVGVSTLDLYWHRNDNNNNDDADVDGHGDRRGDDGGSSFCDISLLS